MRLLNTHTLELSRPYVPGDVPDYAILSHRWNTEEVTFADITNASNPQVQGQLRARNGFAKIQGACKQALKDGYAWIWIDSCCIDKSSSAELQEAINSMWRYYAESNICYAYLADVPDSEAGWGPMFAESEWFTRGWTLQELIAPTCVEFFAENWVAIGTKFQRYEQIAEITSINPEVLIRVVKVDALSAAEKLSWASHRNVTRGEDEAYSLMGLFDVNIPLLYGEGREKAFRRLQQAIYDTTADHSMFLFRYSRYYVSHPLLANSPTSFCDRINCALCLSPNMTLPSTLHYCDIMASERWRIQSHEQITTISTTTGKHASTVLPLLAYPEVANMLVFLDIETKGLAVTHVAVLNFTLKQYPQGALCLLLDRRPGTEGCLRLHVVPAVLPHVGKWERRLEKTRLLIYTGLEILGNVKATEVAFSLNSNAFQVEGWDAKGSSSHSLIPAQPGQQLAFKLEIKRPDEYEYSVRVLCLISAIQNPEVSLIIQLAELRNVWYIKKISERGKSDPGIHTLFRSSILADRCTVRFLDGKEVLVQLRRLPSAVRAPAGDAIERYRYQISLDYLT